MTNKRPEESRSNYRWNPSSFQLFSDPGLEKSHPLLANLSTGRTDGMANVRLPKLVSNIKPYYESPCCKMLMAEKLKLLKKLWNDCGISENHQNEFIQKYFFSKHPHDTYKFISEEVMNSFAMKWLDVRLRGLIEQREYIMKRLSTMVDELVHYHKIMGHLSKSKFKKRKEFGELSKTKSVSSKKSFSLRTALRIRKKKEEYLVFQENSKKSIHTSSAVSSSQSKKSIHSTNRSNRYSREGDSNCPSRSGETSREGRNFLKNIPQRICKEIVDKVEEHIQIYRTVSVYIIEYIESLNHKKYSSSQHFQTGQNAKNRKENSSNFYDPDLNEAKSKTKNLEDDGEGNENVYFWNDKDYLLKMFSDFSILVVNNNHLMEVLEILQVSPARLCFPLFPSLYQESFDTQNFVNISPTSNFENPERFSEGVSEKVEVDEQGGKGGIENLLSDEEDQMPILSINPHFDEKRADRSNLTFLTELKSYRENKRSLKLSNNNKKANIIDVEKLKQERKKHQDLELKKRLTMRTLHQYINLKPLLSVQNFRDRRKRHKKYAEPLFSVRHEDLCREANINPFDRSVQHLFLGIGTSYNYNSSKKSDARGKNSGKKKKFGIGVQRVLGKKKRKRKKNFGRSQIYNPVNLWKELLRVKCGEEKLQNHYLKYKRLTTGMNGKRKKLVFHKIL